MILSRSAAACAVAVCALTACSDGADTGTGADRPAASIVATTSIWADIASNVLCGEPVATLIPAGADPHTFEPSLRDRESLEHAEFVIANGSGLEGSLLDLLETVDGTTLIEMTPHIDVIVTDDDAEHDDDAGDDDGHGHGLDADPHVWHDPTRVAGALDVIASAGSAIGLPDCSDDYAEELFTLDAEITDLLADVPAESRTMVTSHDALAYFADRYDFEIVGTVIPSTNTLAETNAADLADLADLIDARGVRAIFTEELESTADADALAERLDVLLVPLVTDALTDDPATDTYVEMLRWNATQIAGALAP